MKSVLWPPKLLVSPDQSLQVQPTKAVNKPIAKTFSGPQPRCPVTTAVRHTFTTKPSLLRSGLRKISQRLATLEPRILNDGSISITREVSRPLHERLALVVARGNWEAANRAHSARVAELLLGGDDRVGDIMVNSGMSFKLDLQLVTILERPLHDLRVG